MTHVSIIKTRNGEYRGFNCIGHSGYADAGEDIVCAAISVLVINTINSLDQLAGEKFKLVTNTEIAAHTMSSPASAYPECPIQLNPLYSPVLVLIIET